MYVGYQLLITACEMHILRDLPKARAAQNWICSSNAIVITTETFTWSTVALV